MASELRQALFDCSEKTKRVESKDICSAQQTCTKIAKAFHY